MEKTNRARMFLSLFVTLITVMDTGCGRGPATVVQQVPQQTAGAVPMDAAAMAGVTANTSATEPGMVAVDPAQQAGLQGPLAASFGVTVIRTGPPPFMGPGRFGGWGGRGWGRPWRHFMRKAWGRDFRNSWGPLGPGRRPIFVQVNNNINIAQPAAPAPVAPAAPTT